jgi:hypothetical protein
MLAASTALGVQLRCGSANADEQRLVLMSEPLSYTDVVDALEAGDRFDLNAKLAFSRQLTTASVLRERAGAATGATARDAATSRHVHNQLDLQIDVGLHRDLMAFVAGPLVLSDTRNLSRPDEVSAQDAATRLEEVTSTGATAALFSVPFASPVRAGFDHIAFGGAYAPVTQARARHWPTWVILVSAERAIGTLLSPCADTRAGRVCGTQSSVDLDGDGTLDGTRSTLHTPGMSRGVSAFVAETRISRRTGPLEPYAGLGARVEWASTARTRFAPHGDLPGYPSMLPPRQMHATLGAAYIPWEHRGRHQRAAVDLRLMARYFSSGRDYSPLFDALGTSAHPDLARPHPEGLLREASAGDQTACTADASGACNVGARVPFYGLTDLSPRIHYAARLALEVQAARFVRFDFAAAMGWMTPYFAAASVPCGGGSSAGNRGQGLDAVSCGDHASNPAYRAVIDAPGHRFVIRDEWTLSLSASATAQF